jgi:hypothetical protein
VINFSWLSAPLLLSIVLLAGCPLPTLEMNQAETGELAGGELSPLEDGVLAATATPVSQAVSADELWHDALKTGMSAALLAQKAISAQDWELVATRWGRAIDSLQTIPDQASNYSEAQAKIEEYRQNQEIAQQRQQRLTPALANSNPPPTTPSQPAANPAARQAPPVAAASTAAPASTGNPAPAAAPTVASTLCQGVTANRSGPSLALSRIQFQRPPQNPFSFGGSGFDRDRDEDYMIGCLTNNSRQAISSVQISFTSKLGGGSGFSMGSVDFPGSVIPPGGTVPFRAGSSINPQTTEIVVTQLAGLDSAYDPIAMVEPQLKLAYTPSPVTPALTNQFCNAVRPTQTNQIFEVSQLQFFQPPYDPYDFEETPQIYLVGCITNHSNQPLSNLGLAYSRGENHGGGATVQIPGNAVAPGQTVAFRKFGDIDANQTSITVISLGSNLGTIDLNVTVNR